VVVVVVVALAEAGMVVVVVVVVVEGDVEAVRCPPHPVDQGLDCMWVAVGGTGGTVEWEGKLVAPPTPLPLPG
jgi:hypothetical protein